MACSLALFGLVSLHLPFVYQYEVPGLRLPTPYAQIDSGPVYGKIQTTTNSAKPILAFLGIPYAAPPVDQNRFREPKPITQWKDTMMVTQYGAHCPQDVSLNHVFHPLQMPHNVTSEDCLYLNVYTSSLSGEMPVFVWIHGGGFVFGSGSMYDGTALATFHDIVVVTFNYRLGALGFLSTADEHMPGNAAFLDQRAVLHWVRRNIGNFGGDPEKVTIAGESAGSAAVSVHVTARGSAGLFRRAISQSGMPFMLIQKEADLRHQAVGVAEKLGCDTRNVERMVKCLQESPLDGIFAASSHIAETFSYGVTPNGDFVGTDTLDAYKRNDYNKVEYLITFNENEGFMGVQWFNIGDVRDRAGFRETFRQSLTQLTDQDVDIIADRATALYVPDPHANNTNGHLTQQMVKMIGHFQTAAPSYIAAKAHSKGVHDTYMLIFRHRPSYSQLPDWVVCDHAQEIPFEFGVMFLPETTSHMNPESKDDSHVSRMLMQYISNFVHTGNPNSDGLVEWPPFGRAEQFLSVSRNPVVDHKFDENYMKFWIEELPLLLRNPGSARVEL